MNTRIEKTGFTSLIKRFDQARNSFQRARDYALASVAKLVRNKAKDMARNRVGTKDGTEYQANQLGWPQLSPFTGTISANKGAKRSAFTWAKDTVGQMGAGPAWQAFLNPDRKGRFALSRNDAGALKREIRMAEGKKLRRRKAVKKSNRAQPLAKLIGFVRSKINAAAGSVTIGFFRNVGDSMPDSNLESLVEKQARGYAVTVTERMRRFLFAIGFPTNRRSFVIPPRPWFAPVFNAVRTVIPEQFRAKFLSRIMPALNGAANAVERWAA